MFVPAGGYLLNTVEFGTGPDTFVAHGGWVGSWELWQQPFQLMQDRWRCIGYDHRGSGASTAPASAITPEALVDDLFTVLDGFGVEQCVLAGESLGALTCVLTGATTATVASSGRGSPGARPTNGIPAVRPAARRLLAEKRGGRWRTDLASHWSLPVQRCDLNGSSRGPTLRQ